MRRRSESACFEECVGDVVGEVAAPECGTAELVESSLDGFDGAVTGARLVQVGEDVPSAPGQGAAEFAQLDQGGIDGQSIDERPVLAGRDDGTCPGRHREADDVKGMHNRDHVGQFFGGGGREPGDVFRFDSLDPVTPGQVPVCEPVLEALLRPALDSVHQTRRVSDWQSLHLPQDRVVGRVPGHSQPLADAGPSTDTSRRSRPDPGRTTPPV